VELVQLSDEPVLSSEQEWLRPAFAQMRDARKKLLPQLNAVAKLQLLWRSEDPRLGTFFRYRTDRSSPIIKTIANLEDPIVVSFINAKTDKARQAFFSYFGLPAPRLDRAEYKKVLQLQEEALFSLKAAVSENRQEAIQAADLASLPRFELTLRLGAESGEPQMVLKTDTLATVMEFECLLAAQHGARAHECDRCKSVFLTGPLTGRRSTARYCRDTCRTESWKNRKAREAKNG
jgi:hypothetical protein